MAGSVRGNSRGRIELSVDLGIVGDVTADRWNRSVPRKRVAQSLFDGALIIIQRARKSGQPLRLLEEAAKLAALFPRSGLSNVEISDYLRLKASEHDAPFVLASDEESDLD
jgi:hypothetical protein